MDRIRQLVLSIVVSGSNPSSSPFVRINQLSPPHNHWKSKGRGQPSDSDSFSPRANGAALKPPRLSGLYLHSASLTRQSLTDGGDHRTAGKLPGLPWVGAAPRFRVMWPNVAQETAMLYPSRTVANRTPTPTPIYLQRY